MNKMKLGKLFSIIGIIVVIIGISLLIINITSKSDTKNNDIDKEIMKLVKNDYEISTIIYGIPDTKDDTFKLEGIEYKAVNNDKFKEVSYTSSLVRNTYTGVTYSYYLEDINKYNKYMSIDDIIYVNINSKCDVGKFDNNISTYYDKNNNKIVKNNKREAKVIKIDGKYRLDGSLYKCIG